MELPLDKIKAAIPAPRLYTAKPKKGARWQEKGDRWRVQLRWIHNNRHVATVLGDTLEEAVALATKMKDGYNREAEK